VIWERPKELTLIALSLALVASMIGLVAQALLEPYQPVLEEYMTGVAVDPALAMRIMLESVEREGYARFAAGLIAPWFAIPLTVLALSRAALGMWDGYAVGLVDVGYAVRRYATALKVAAFVTIYAFFLGLASLLSFLPYLILKALFASAARGAPELVFLAGSALWLLIFVKFVWPHLRRVLALQFVAFFQLIDGAVGPWGVRLVFLYGYLKRFPNHLNQNGAALCGSLIVLSLALSILTAFLVLLRIPWPAVELAIRFIFHFCMLGPVIAMAGLYRLVLFPRTDEEEAAS
jgi:hypothetical protein